MYKKHPVFGGKNSPITCNHQILVGLHIRCLSIVIKQELDGSPAANGVVGWSPASLFQRVAGETVADDHLQVFCFQ